MRILIDHTGDKGIGDIVCETGLYEIIASGGTTLVSRGSRTLAWAHPLIDEFDEHSADDCFGEIIRMRVDCVAASLEVALAEKRTIFSHYLAAHGFAPSTTPPRLYVTRNEIAATTITRESDEFLIAISADSKEPDRRWGEERFAALAQTIAQRHRVRFFEIGNALQAGSLGVGEDLVGKLDLRASLALLFQVDLFIGNHGGQTHLAGAIGTPALCPWGASAPYPAYAYDAISVAIQTTPACRNCSFTGSLLPECRTADRRTGRVPCTQAISVDDMARAADELLPRLVALRGHITAQKQHRLEQARDPISLTRFETRSEVTPFSHQHLFLGGIPGWGAEHRRDNFARLKKIVAFPDWNDTETWQPLIADFVAQHRADSAETLVLSAFPLTGPEVARTVGGFAQAQRRAQPPKILVILGPISEEERADLKRRAAILV